LALLGLLPLGSYPMPTIFYYFVNFRQVFSKKLTEIFCPVSVKKLKSPFLGKKLSFCDAAK
jgi:hypothetical protein